MTEREAAAAVFGASVAFQSVVTAMREAVENDRGELSAREVLAWMTTGYEERLSEVLRLFYAEALKTELEDILS